MLLLLALSALSIATLGSVVVYQRRSVARLKGQEEEMPRLEATDEEELREPTLQTLRLGDVVLEGEEDWLIVGTLTYREEQETWWVHTLEDGPRRRHLEVRRRETWEPAFLTPADDAPTFGELYAGLTFRGQPYRLHRRGDAHLRAEGDVQGVSKEGLIRYISYHGPGGARLNIEETDSSRLAFAGDQVAAATLSFMPGAYPSAGISDQFSIDDSVE